MRFFPLRDAENEESRPAYLTGKVVAGVFGGLFASFFFVLLLLMAWAKHAPGLLVAVPLSLTVVGVAFVTGPVSVAMLIMGARGSYYAFLSVTVLIVFCSFVYVQVKYFPQRFWPLLATVDVFLFFALLWVARLLMQSS